MIDVYYNTENNIIIDNFLPNDLYNSLTGYIQNELIKKEWVSTHKNELTDESNKNKVKINTDLGRIRLEVKPEPALLKYIEEYARQYTKNIIFQHAYFVEYNKKYGIPNLPPHVDDNFEYARLTFDIQLSSNKLWKIFVEDNDFELHENEGLVFSGTHQVHWREKVIFDNTDYVDMLLCQFSNPSLLSKPINLKFKSDIRSRANIFKLQYNKKG